MSNRVIDKETVLEAKFIEDGGFITMIVPARKSTESDAYLEFTAGGMRELIPIMTNIVKVVDERFEKRVRKNTKAS